MQASGSSFEALALKMASRLGQLLAVLTTEASATFLRSRLEITSVSSSAVAAPEPLLVIEYIAVALLGTGLVLKRKVKTENSQLRHKYCLKL